MSAWFALAIATFFVGSAIEARRFSLRSLLIGMTMFAVFLGLIVYATGK
jgi:hypothetical protein